LSTLIFQLIKSSVIYLFTSSSPYDEALVATLRSTAYFQASLTFTNSIFDNLRQASNSEIGSGWLVH